MIKIGNYRFNKEDILFYSFNDFFGHDITFHFRNGQDISVNFITKELAKEKIAEIDKEFGVKKIH